MGGVERYDVEAGGSDLERVGPTRRDAALQCRVGPWWTTDVGVNHEALAAFERLRRRVDDRVDHHELIGQLVEATMTQQHAEMVAHPFVATVQERPL